MSVILTRHPTPPSVILFHTKQLTGANTSLLTKIIMSFSRALNSPSFYLFLRAVIILHFTLHTDVGNSEMQCHICYRKHSITAVAFMTLETNNRVNKKILYEG